MVARHGMSASPEQERYELALRAYAVPVKKKARTEVHPTEWSSELRRETVPEVGPSDWVLVFDSETKTDAAQQLRVGLYQLRHGEQLIEEGSFADLETLTQREQAVLRRFLEADRLPLRSVARFRELIFRVLAKLNGTLVGFNLPYDISRIALAHEAGRGRNAGGFSFALFEDPRARRLQVRHLNQRAAFMHLSSRGVPPRSFRKKGWAIEQHGHIVDAKTAASALLGGSYSLKTLAELLRTEHRKLDAGDEHGGPLTWDYLTYARNDVQVTWECFAKLRDRYAGYGLTTPLSRILSGAGLGKAVLKDMKVRPFRGRQPDFPPDVLGKLMATYHGGRAEVHDRRVVKRVMYLDVHSEYPSVCVLMGLWRFVTAERTETYDATDETRILLSQITLEHLQRPETWRHLAAILEIDARDDILPTRARYSDAGYTIGVQHYTGRRWVTLADAMSSKIRTGRAPRVMSAIGFRPVGVQDGLTTVDLLGDARFRVDPRTTDLYKRLIDVRDELKEHEQAARAAGDAVLADELKAKGRALKELANSSAYGIFLELNVRRYARSRVVLVYGHGDRPFRVNMTQIEEPGRYFDPLIATLVTGAGRLLLMLAEVLGERKGLGWMFCDTDSWCLSKPDDMDEGGFVERAIGVQRWFDPLNPYAKKQPLFKLEDQNFALDKRARPTAEFVPLFGFAVAAKRNVLFNLGSDGRPVLRKVSAHGLGHLLQPYGGQDAPANIPTPRVGLDELECERWQYDLWYRVVVAALEGHSEQVVLDDLPGFARPAATRYAATTPELLRWFTRFNATKAYAGQVRPFGFMIAFQAKADPRLDDELPAVIAPYDKDVERAAAKAFDRRTGGPVPRSRLRTYRQALAQYHLHPEAKFRHADYTDAGTTERRHVSSLLTTYIGKEANELEIQYYLGMEEERSIIYGAPPKEARRLRALARKRIRLHGVRAMARATGVSMALLSMAAGQQRKLSVGVANRVLSARLDGIRDPTSARGEEGPPHADRRTGAMMNPKRGRRANG